MKLEMRTLWITCLLFLGSLPLGDKFLEVHALFKRASQKDKTVFASGYLAEAFSSWQKNIKFDTFMVDSQFIKGAYEEIWLHRTGSSKFPSYSIALLVSRNSQMRIVEVRRLLVINRSGLQPIEQKVMEFIEQFVWTYEIGVDSFIQDFLYPEYIKIRYGGLSNRNEILKRLRSEFTNTLDIRSLGWNGENSFFMIRLVLNSPLEPLEITVDLQRYLTSRFFNLADEAQRVSDLKDSITAWQGQKSPTSTGTGLRVLSRSPQNAIRTIFQQYFKEYHIIVIDSANAKVTIEAALPPIDELRPANLKCQLIATRFDTATFRIQSTWLTRKAFNNNLLSQDSKKRRTIKGFIDTFIFSKLLDKTFHRYSTLGLPTPLQPQIEVTDGFEGLLVLHHAKVDTLKWPGSRAFANLLNGLAHGKLTYFFLRGIVSNYPKVTINGYAMWKDEQLFWHHVAKINDVYDKVDGKFQLKNVIIDLYPFIRTDNLRALFAESDSASYRKEKIVIRR